MVNLIRIIDRPALDIRLVLAKIEEQMGLPAFLFQPNKFCKQLDMPVYDSDAIKDKLQFNNFWSEGFLVHWLTTAYLQVRRRLLLWQKISTNQKGKPKSRH